MNGPQRHPMAAAGNTEQAVKDRCVHGLHVTLTRNQSRRQIICDKGMHLFLNLL